MILAMTMEPEEVEHFTQVVERAAPSIKVTDAKYLGKPGGSFPELHIFFVERDIDALVAAIKEARKHLYSQLKGA